VSAVAWDPPSELCFVVERFTHAVGADIGILAQVEDDRPLLYEVSREAGTLRPFRSPYRGAVVAALEDTHEAHIRHVGVPGGAGSDLLLAPVEWPDGPPALLCGALPPGADDHDAALWLGASYASILALCAADPAGVGQLLASTREDSLTGCDTRVALRDRLTEEIARAERHHRSLACLFLDLDGFKHINDQWGHLVGDEVLASAGGAMRRCLRGADAIGRVGGDEFVLVLPETPLDRAVSLAGRLRGALRDSAQDLIHTDLNASVGIAGFEPGDTGDDLMRRADDALLVAKRRDAGLYAAASRARH
jgi:diguanylate cyclase (GGDEF)-like protein